MSTTPMTARFDGKVLVPEGLLDAAPGDVFEIVPKRSSMTQEEWLGFLQGTAGSWVGPQMDDADEPPVAKPQTSEEWEAFVRRTAGAWADFDGYEDPEDPPPEDEEPFF